MNETAESGVRFIQVTEEQAGQRIDNFLLARLKGVPKSRIYRILRRGEVRVNRGRAKPEYRVRAGDEVRIPPLRTAESVPAPSPGKGVLERLDAAVLFEDERLLVLNKPAGIAVHGGSGLSYGVIEALRVLRPQARFLELGHRLDRDTSGCLVIAKRRSALRAFQERLRSGAVDKRYLALVQGAWPGAHEERAPLRKNVLSSGERVVRVAADGKSALTRFRAVTVYGDATLVEAELVTGRTHQVRVHTAHAGHPIAGDGKYGDAEFNRALAAKGLKRLFLHAHEVAFRLGDDDATTRVQAPLPPELTSVLAQLKEER